MKIQITAFNLFIIFSMVTSAFAKTTANNTPPATLKLDNKTWTLQVNKENNYFQVALYVPANRKSGKTEDFFFQRLQLPVNATVTPAEFVNQEISLFKKQGYKVSSKILEANATEAIVDLTVQKAREIAREDLERVSIRADHSIVVFHYGVTSPQMTAALRNKWISILKNIDTSLFVK